MPLDGNGRLFYAVFYLRGEAFCIIGIERDIDREHFVVVPLIGIIEALFYLCHVLIGDKVSVVMCGEVVVRPTYGVAAIGTRRYKKGD